MEGSSAYVELCAGNLKAPNQAVTHENEKQCLAMEGQHNQDGFKEVDINEDTCWNRTQQSCCR